MEEVNAWVVGVNQKRVFFEMGNSVFLVTQAYEYPTGMKLQEQKTERKGKSFVKHKGGRKCKRWTRAEIILLKTFLSQNRSPNQREQFRRRLGRSKAAFNCASSKIKQGLW